MPSVGSEVGGNPWEMHTLVVSGSQVASPSPVASQEIPQGCIV